MYRLSKRCIRQSPCPLAKMLLFSWLRNDKAVYLVNCLLYCVVLTIDKAENPVRGRSLRGMLSGTFVASPGWSSRTEGILGGKLQGEITGCVLEERGRTALQREFGEWGWGMALGMGKSWLLSSRSYIHRVAKKFVPVFPYCLTENSNELFGQSNM